MTNYQVIKQTAKDSGVSVKDLIALAPANDPFYSGSKSQVSAARWFAGLWQRFGYGDNVHLRRVHYQAMSQEPPILKPNGGPYENTDNDWNYLCKAGKYARYLGLIAPTAFVDRRNPSAVLYARWHHPGDSEYTDPTPGYGVVDSGWEWEYYALPDIPRLDPIGYDDIPTLPQFRVSGYDDGIQQDYHVEVWVEKTTMNDVLLPLCQKYGVNLVTGAGEMSITAVVDFMRRARQSGRAARILYISDYDPAGLGMPISVARKIEFFQRRDNDADLDIRLHPLALTSDQVRAHDLPRKPGKSTDKQKENWERDHGKGVVELDALEALHPGVLGDMVENAILGYYDTDLVERAKAQRQRLEADLVDVRRDALRRHAQDAIKVRDDYKQLQADFAETQKEFDETMAGFAPKVEAYRERLNKIVERGEELYGEMYADVDDAGDLDTDDYPLPEPDLPREGDSTLYVSGLDYFDQLERYKLYRRNEN